ncbi:MAG: hypothetical protein VB120_04270 [Lachnospiraceae bacterium]|nr:hypothetical protein [Lachnospiraceae bacterium]
MKFAELRYSKDPYDILEGRFIKRLPDTLKDIYIRQKCPCKYEEIEINGGLGYTVTLPLSKNDLNKRRYDCKKIITRTADFLKEKDVGIVVAPGIDFDIGLRISEGRAIMAIFILPVIKKILKDRGKSLKDAEILIMGKSDFLTKLVIDSLYSGVNFLSVYTDNENTFFELAEEIENDVGLNMNIFSEKKNSAIRGADVIINTGMPFQNIFKKGSSYIELGKNKSHAKKLSLKRSDMFFIDSFNMLISGKTYGKELFEAYAYSQFAEFSRFLNNEYDRSRALYILDFFNAFDIKITSCGFLG